MPVHIRSGTLSKFYINLARTSISLMPSAGDILTLPLTPGQESSVCKRDSTRHVLSTTWTASAHHYSHSVLGSSLNLPLSSQALMTLTAEEYSPSSTPDWLQEHGGTNNRPNDISPSLQTEDSTHSGPIRMTWWPSPRTSMQTYDHQAPSTTPSAVCGPEHVSWGLHTSF